MCVCGVVHVGVCVWCVCDVVLHVCECVVMCMWCECCVCVQCV